MLQIDDYILEYKIGSGSYAHVYYTTKKETLSIFATKKIEKNKIINDKMTDYYFNEIEILKNINHPNIIKLHEIKNTANNTYLIMEYCNGGTLIDFFEKYQNLFNRPFPEIYFQHIFKQIASGINYLHKSRIIHRDIKTENILLNFRNIEDLKSFNLLNADVKIIDFGFAKYLDDKKIETSICGSPINMDPKILKALAYKQLDEDFSYDETSDMWSLGIMAFSMLVGIPPFISANYLDLYTKINQGNYLIPKKLNLSKQTISLLNYLLQFNSKERIKVEDLLNHDFLTMNAKDFDYSKINFLTENELDYILNSKQNFFKIYENKNISYEPYIITNTKEIISSENNQNRVSSIENHTEILNNLNNMKSINNNLPFYSTINNLEENRNGIIDKEIKNIMNEKDHNNIFSYNLYKKNYLPENKTYQNFDTLPDSANSVINTSYSGINYLNNFEKLKLEEHKNITNINYFDKFNLYNENSLPSLNNNYQNLNSNYKYNPENKNISQIDQNNINNEDNFSYNINPINNDPIYKTFDTNQKNNIPDIKSEQLTQTPFYSPNLPLTGNSYNDVNLNQDSYYSKFISQNKTAEQNSNFNNHDLLSANKNLNDNYLNTPVGLNFTSDITKNNTFNLPVYTNINEGLNMNNNIINYQVKPIEINNLNFQGSLIDDSNKISDVYSKYIENSKLILEKYDKENNIKVSEYNYSTNNLEKTN